MEPWAKVFIKLGSAKSFDELEPIHNAGGCTACHGGSDNLKSQDDSDEALRAVMDQTHEGLIARPSVNAGETCGQSGCHTDIAQRNESSVHSQLWGERHVLATRAGYESFDECPAELRNGFTSECMSCHTTCGQCHISRPASAHGGLVKGHLFNRTPSMIENCTGCHGSRIGNDYLGKLEGNDPDIHFTMKGYTCIDCHKEDLHGTGQTGIESRYQVEGLPSCGTDCHADLQANTYHLIHGGTSERQLSCYVCHSQPTLSCNSCHTNGEWEDGGGYEEYPEFRIGHHADLPGGRAKWVVVRHVPVTRDTYAPWGWDDLAAYDQYPTWKYASPHNIQRWTAQTTPVEGGTCSSSCHVDGDQAPQNKHLFLWQSFIDGSYGDEVTSNRNVVVDDHLPASWTKY